MKRFSTAVLLSAALTGTVTVASAPTRGWRVDDWRGAPALFHDGKPVPPILFWQWEMQEPDAKALSRAGIGLFSMFGSFGHYAHPYFTEKGFAGLGYQEWNIDNLLTWVPSAAFKAVPLYTLFQSVLAKLGEPWSDAWIGGEFPEKTWTELGSWHETSGLLEEALECYAKARGSIIAAVRAAYVAHRLGDGCRASALLDAAASLDLGFDFPFRAESQAALVWATEHNASWKFRYLLALLYAGKARNAEADDELRKCGQAMDHVPALIYRAQRLGGDAARADLKKAAEIADSWRVGVGIYQLCAAENRWAEAKRTLGDYVRRFPGKLGLELNYARALIKTVALAEAVSFLETLNALPSELGEKPGTLYQEALGALADAALGRGDRVAASAYVKKALSAPERLWTGRQSSDDRVIDSWPRRVQEFARGA